ncbi:hypothetical protein FB45DRAFT_889898 [Roridomyces roridus]|uniref:Uncharacterized protein n=1 Tax=Roridomyces roridus TaxID=1738132 RepID=A0AAD7G1Y1_9AGAR|nr:hypothetical protein FB45DRAFT_889898 [Roridomyces roridus]
MMRPRELEAFFRAMIANPERADATRSLTFTNEYSDFHYNASFYDLLIESTRLMRKLEHFSVLDESSNTATRKISILTCLASLEFPCLLTCGIDITAKRGGCQDSAVGHFLARHTTVTRLRLWSYGEFENPVYTRALLPDLQHYDGTIQFLPMVSSRRLAKVRLPWAAYADFGAILEALRVTLDSHLPIVLFFDHFFSPQKDVPEILSLLAEKIPHVTSLQISTTRCEDRPPPEETLNGLTECLPRFSRLKYIALKNTSPELIPWQSWPWAESVPTLKACSIGRRAWRKVDGVWEEYREEEFEAEAGFSGFDPFRI